MVEQRWRALLSAGALLCLGVAIWFVSSRDAVRLIPGYDATYSLAWGRDIMAGDGLYLGNLSSPTPHPLAVLWGIVVAAVPEAVRPLAVTVGSVLAGAATVVLVALVSWSTSRSHSAVATAAITVLVSAPFALLVLDVAADVVYVAIALLGVLATLQRRYLGGVIALIVASLLRPEALLLALVPLAASLRRSRPGAVTRRGRFLATYVGGTVASILSWLLIGVAGGDPLAAFHSASGNSMLNNDPRGPVTAVITVFPHLVSVVGWPVTVLAAGGIIALVIASRRRTGHGLPEPLRPLALVLVFVALGVVAYLLQGFLGTPLVARYLALPGILCAPAAAGVIANIAGLVKPGRARAAAFTTLAVVVGAASIAVNVPGWRELVTVRTVRSEVLSDADHLLSHQLARQCPGEITVRSPAVVPNVALTLGRPLSAVRVGDEPVADGVLLQPLTRDAAELAGLGPSTGISRQGAFPRTASPRASSVHWALYSNCVLGATP